MSIMQMLLATAAGEEAENYWFARIGGTADDLGRGIAYDSSGNVYPVGYHEVTNQNAQIVKYDSSGTIQWQRTIKGTGSFDNDAFEDIAIDSSGNIYAAGKVDGGPNCLLAKYNASGVLQWQRQLADGSNFSTFAAVALDSSGNVYAAGTQGNGDTGIHDCLITKYNSSGTLQWQRSLGRASKYTGFYSMTIDGSNNIYAVGSGNDGSPTGLVAKYNTSGTLQWHKHIKDSSHTIGSTQGVGTDSSGNVYALGFANIPDEGNTIYAAKLNSSGAMQWSRTVDHVANRIEETFGGGVTSTGDVYIFGEGYINSSSNLDGIIVKLNSSGALQFARTFGTTTTNDSFRTGKVDGNGNMFIVGATQEGAVGQRDMWTLKLPDDGSLTGTYSNLVYQSVSKTVTTESYTADTGTMTAATPSLSASTPTHTEEATTFTNTTTSVS